VLPHGFLQILATYDVEPIKNAPALMARHLHRHPFRHSRSDHVPYGGSPEIMEDLGGDFQFRRLFVEQDGS